MTSALPSRSGVIFILMPLTPQPSGGASGLRNGELLDRVESDHYDAFITTDTKLKYQQNLTKRTVRILALTSTSWPQIRKKTDQIRAALEGLGQGGYAEVVI